MDQQNGTKRKGRPIRALLKGEHQKNELFWGGPIQVRIASFSTPKKGSLLEKGD